MKIILYAQKGGSENSIISALKLSGIELRAKFDSFESLKDYLAMNKVDLVLINGDQRPIKDELYIVNYIRKLFSAFPILLTYQYDIVSPLIADSRMIVKQSGNKELVVKEIFNHISNM